MSRLRIRLGTTSSDLWNLCQVYGTVVDVYIPNRRKKVGKRFAFVRFIKVDNVDRLVGNICTLWIGRMHLHANVVRFERSPLQSSRASQPIRPDKIAPLFVSTVKGFSVVPLSASPAMVLDDSCMVTRDLGNYVMGEVKQFSYINNLRVLLSNERFHNVQLVYLGGLWVMIELKSSKSKAKFLNHVGVASWFNCLSNAQSDFVYRDRIVWGVHMHAWSRNTFYKIGSKWGEVLELEECRDDFFARKQICIKTKQEDNILEKFKIIVKGKIFVVRAKELFVWSPTFKDVHEMVYCSDDDSAKEMGVNQTEFSKQTNLEDESNSEAVFDTYFGDNTDELGNVADSVQPPTKKEISNDPFNIYELHNKYDKEVDNTGTDSSIPFPPGFTPVKDIYKEAEQDMRADQVRGSGFKHSEDGSILEILDEMIKVGQTMGFSMDGCTKDMEKIIGSQGVHETADARDSMQKAKIQWAIEGDKNSKFFHGIINRKRANLAVKGIMIDGEWVDDPSRVKDEFRTHFAARFQDLGICHSRINFSFPNRSNLQQATDLENPITRDEIHNAQGGPLASYLFILIMETLHFSFSRVIDAGIFTGVWIDSSLMISHLFYAGDAVFIGEWSHDNLKGIMHMLRYYSLMSGLSINLNKSHLLGVGIPASCVHEAATSLGCLVMKALFKYLGIMVGGNMSLVKAWDDTVEKLKGRLSKWKLKTLSIGGRLTLLKSVLGSTPIYNMSLYKVPKTVLNLMEAICRNFFNGIHDDERKIWDMNGHGVFRVKDVRILLDEVFLPNDATPTRWIKSIPIKVNVFAWKDEVVFAGGQNTIISSTKVEEAQNPFENCNIGALKGKGTCKRCGF
nr:RNA-directed DNA polymerase, eukaryota [Tanacetum cinerariifolium]